MDPPFVIGRPVTRAAYLWAQERHRGQLREVDQAPFILHPLEVAALLSGRDHDDEVVAAGLLHDVLEDTATSVEEVRAAFGDRVATIVAQVTEDPTIEDWSDRKAALRTQVAAAGMEAVAVYAADKVVKARELRAQEARAAAPDPALLRRLEHYRGSLDMLTAAAPDSPLVRQLAFELWALEQLPPA